MNTQLARSAGRMVTVSTSAAKALKNALLVKPVLDTSLARSSGTVANGGAPAPTSTEYAGRSDDENMVRPPEPSGISTTTMVAAGAGIVALGVVAVVLLKKKKRRK